MLKYVKQKEFYQNTMKALKALWFTSNSYKFMFVLKKLERSFYAFMLRVFFNH